VRFFSQRLGFSGMRLLHDPALGGALARQR
jgi:hypothetical protein